MADGLAERLAEVTRVAMSPESRRECSSDCGDMGFMYWEMRVRRSSAILPCASLNLANRVCLRSFLAAGDARLKPDTWPCSMSWKRATKSLKSKTPLQNHRRLVMKETLV